MPREIAMTMVDRRTVLMGLAAPLVASAALGGGAGSARAAQAGERIALPQPRLDRGTPLMEAIARRRSTRVFAPTPLGDEVLSDVLFAANGLNRPEREGRTAPSWRGSHGNDVLVAREDGVWLYDAHENALVRRMEDDIRAEIGNQAFVGTAPAVLIFVADLDRMVEAPEEVQRRYAAIDAGFMSQNVYLYAASEGLATVVIGNIQAETLPGRLGLGAREMVTFAQPIGYPD